MSKRHKKIEIDVTLEHVPQYLLEGSLDGVIAELKELQEKYKDVDNLRLSLNIECNYGDQFIDVVLKGSRLETDKEFEKRIALVERAKARRKEQYVALKKEFEGTE